MDKIFTVLTVTVHPLKLTGEPSDSNTKLDRMYQVARAEYRVDFPCRFIGSLALDWLEVGKLTCVPTALINMGRQQSVGLW